LSHGGPGSGSVAERIVIASSNPGKQREVREILAGKTVQGRALALIGLADLPLVSFPEEGADYRSNAIEKARAVAMQAGEVALADDSGLEVDALEGRPGPHSARYGGSGLDDAGRVELLLRELQAIPLASRGARFVCVAALVTPGGEVFCGRGECRGEILTGARGQAGFGYDPVFRVSGLTRTMAELSADEKNRVSHRARALQTLFESDGVLCLDPGP
jgi:XTP/dITP diphosphohydrolase